MLCCPRCVCAWRMPWASVSRSCSSTALHLLDTTTHSGVSLLPSFCRCGCCVMWLLYCLYLLVDDKYTAQLCMHGSAHLAAKLTRTGFIACNQRLVQHGISGLSKRQFSRGSLLPTSVPSSCDMNRGRLPAYQRTSLAPHSCSCHACRGALLLQLLDAYAVRYAEMLEGRSEHLPVNELAGGARIRHIFQEIFVAGLNALDPSK